MAQLEVDAAGILFINPDPSRQHIFASHAHPVQVSEHEFISTYQRGSALYAADVDIALTRSLDSGTTWVDEGFIHDRSQDDRPYSYHDGFLSRMDDGLLVAIAFRVDRTDPSRPMLGPAGGIIENELVLFQSRDGGLTFDGPAVLRLPSAGVLTPANPIIELEGGQWLATFDQWHRLDEPGPYRPRMVGFMSSDRGQTWSDSIVIADGLDQGIGYWHGKTIPLARGRVYSTFWTADLGDPALGPVDLPIHQSTNQPGESHWPSPESTLVPGQSHWPAKAPGGVLCLVYTWRLTEQPGIMAVLSEDGGRTWNLEHQVRLWDASGWTNLGVNSPEIYPHSHDTVAFGAPTLMTTRQGELYATWWCTYASITHIRWARLKVTR